MDSESVYTSMYRIRRVEEEIARIYPTDKIKSPVHLSLGQEAVSVGVCEALGPDDVVFGSYRGHALYLAKGGDLKGMMAELFGKAAGVAGGKGGSMHLVDPEHGVMGMSAVVGTTIPQAAGYAYSIRLRGGDSVVAAFFGDGATDEGVFHETMSVAALKKLPVIFVCENNRYAVLAHQSTRHAVSNIAERAATYGMHSERIDDNDVEEIFDRTSWATDKLRSGGDGPFFFECMTYRFKEHVGPGDDVGVGSRTREEAEKWKRLDQVARVADLLAPVVRKSIEERVETEIEEAIQYAEDSPFPADEEMFGHVYAQ